MEAVVMNVAPVTLYRSADATRPSGPDPPVIRTIPSDNIAAAAPALTPVRSPVRAHVPLGTTTEDALRNREEAPTTSSNTRLDAEARLMTKPSGEAHHSTDAVRD